MVVTSLRLMSVCLCLLVFTARAGAQTLRIYNIDVEQADAALLVMPNGKTLLIDSGKNGHGQRIKSVMDLAGVTKIDAFVASHYHEDHYGGIDDLVDMGVEVLEAYDRGDKQFVSAATKAQQTYKDYLRTVGEDAKTLRRGDTIPLDPAVTILCIASGGVVLGESAPVAADEENDMSIALFISFGGFRAFFGGDTEDATEVKIAALHLARDVDFYKSSHHGSHSSSLPAFIDDMKPSLIVVSNGDMNHKHPRKVTIDAYQALPGPPVVIQTNKCHESLPCANVADQFIADLESNQDTDGVVETTVDATAGQFTVKWRNDSRTIAIKAATPVPVTATTGPTMVALLPNPAGNDEQAETVTLRNGGSTPMSLSGWILRDRSGLTWDLFGNLAAGQTKTFSRNGQPMSLNNAGDEITLVDPQQAVRDTFTYTAANQGVSIKKP